MSLGVREARMKTELVELHVKEMKRSRTSGLAIVFERGIKKVAVSHTLQ